MKFIISLFIYYVLQSHQFESTFSPTDGYRIRLKELTDGGNYMCHSKHDLTNEHDIHFSIHVNCELNKCHGYATIVNDTPATVVAPISLNQITTISTPNLTTVPTIASNQMVNENRSGVGRSSFSKRHISFNSSTVSIQTPSTVLQSNQHMSLYDVDLTTTTTESILTTARSYPDDVMFRRYSNHRQLPTPSYQLEKTKRRG